MSPRLAMGRLLQRMRLSPGKRHEFSVYRVRRSRSFLQYNITNLYVLSPHGGLAAATG
jgi:hypothetical protein